MHRRTPRLQYPAIVVPLQFNRAEVFIGNFSYQAVARLKPGVTLAQANADVARMLPLLMQKFPPAPGISMKMFEEAHFGLSVRPLKHDVVGDVGKVLWVLMATVGLVLFIACASVANLLLVRAEGRQQELAVRAALGAGWRSRARAASRERDPRRHRRHPRFGCRLGRSAPVAVSVTGQSPRLNEIAIGPAVLLFTLALSLLAGVLFGLIPVFKYAGRQAGTGLREGGRNSSDGRDRHRTRSALVVAQVAIALVLLISSGLMIRTFRALRQVQPGFTSPEEILTLRVSIPDAQMPDADRTLRMQADIMDRIRAIPGVVSVATTNSITMDGATDNDPIFAEDHAYAEGQIPPLRRYMFISPGLFKTMGRPLLVGRDFTWDDLFQKRKYLLVSDNMARELWGSPANAIGKRVRETPKGQWREIIGVAANERDDGVDHKAPTVVYWPSLINDFWQLSVRLERSPVFAVRSSRAGTAAFLKESRTRSGRSTRTSRSPTSGRSRRSMTVRWRALLSRWSCSASRAAWLCCSAWWASTA